MSAILNLIRRLDDERKTGRTFSIFVVSLIVIQQLDASIEAIDLGSNAEVIAGVITPIIEYGWRQIRAAMGLGRTGDAGAV